MFGRKKRVQTSTYDATKMRPVIRASICTGEQVAGFKDLQTGRFSEIMLIRDASDLKQFCTQYGVQPSAITKEY